ncbi:hypothetical protein [Companilactobacillus sp. DQM5]|uniref:hypothetical protein n=1 Tax=Companilactobacillus sp. DQM5 TaxID=3463359 RepID=UPI004058E9D8
MKYFDDEEVNITLYGFLVLFILLGTSIFVAMTASVFVSDEQAAVVWGISWSIQLIIAGLLTYMVLFLAARAEIKTSEMKIRKAREHARQKYLTPPNSLLGLAAGVYMLGLLLLDIGGLGIMEKSGLFELLPMGIMSAILLIIFFIIYVFVLPIFLLLKTPKWFSKALDLVKK